MKTIIQTITVELRWTFIDGGSACRSNVVGGYQAEVDTHSIRIYDTTGQPVTNVPRGGSRKGGMERAAKYIAKMIQGEVRG